MATPTAGAAVAVLAAAVSFVMAIFGGWLVNSRPGGLGDFVGFRSVPALYDYGQDPRVLMWVPGEARPGHSLDVTMPDGRSVKWKVPEGVTGGDTVSLDTFEKVYAKSLVVKVPRGAQAGAELEAVAPNGSLLLWTVPADAKAGDTVTLETLPEPHSGLMRIYLSVKPYIPFCLAVEIVVAVSVLFYTLTQKDKHGEVPANGHGAAKAKTTNGGGAKPKDAQALDTTPMTLKVSIIQANGLKHLNMLGDKTWCQCMVKHTHKNATPSMCRTAQIANNLDPVWNETHELVWHEGESLEFAVYDKGLLVSRQEGCSVKLPSEMFDKRGFEGALPIDGLENATLRIRIEAPRKV